MLHARHYAVTHGFAAVFEAKVAVKLGAFLAGGPGEAHFFRAAEVEGRALGSIALEDEGDGRGHLQWFMLDTALRGTGLGRRWLDAALNHAGACHLTRVHLWTLENLPAAARLYAADLWRRSA